MGAPHATPRFLTLRAAAAAGRGQAPRPGRGLRSLAGAQNERGMIMDSTGKDAKAANGTDGQPQAEGKGEPKDGLVPAPLGESEVYAKVTADGRLVAIRARIVLREDLDHLYEVEGKVAISSLGYPALNRYAGLSLAGA